MNVRERSRPRAERLDLPDPPSAAGVRAYWEPLAVSLAFLTVLPMPQPGRNSAALGKAAAFFPLVGTALGALLGGIGLLLDRLLPPAPTAALLLLTGTVMTGALHLDGLMDAADGVLGGRTIERRLEIMRESQVGAFGATAGILVILSQFACLTELTGTDRFIALVAVFAISRWAMTLALVGFPPARADGLGATLQAGSGDASLAIGTLFALLFALVTSPLGAVIFAGGALVILVGGYLLTRSLGGLTGDTYGALAVLVETLGLYLAVAILTGGTGS